MTQEAQLLPLKHTPVPTDASACIDNLWFEEENPRALSTVVELGEIYSGVLGILSVEPQSPTPTCGLIFQSCCLPAGGLASQKT